MVLASLLACAPTPRDAAGPPDTGAQAAPPGWSTPEVLGPYAVGAHTTVVEHPDGPLTVEVWYPARPAEEARPAGYGPLSVAQSAYRDAPPDRRGAPYPVVAFSHGYGGVRYQSAFLMEHLASHGLVVVAVDHPGHTLFDLDPARTAEVAVERPGQVAAAVDALATLEPPLDQLAEASRYAVVGHSFGAVTALVVGGARLDAERAEAFCASTPTPACGFIEGLPLAGAERASPDPRAVVTVALAPGAHFAFREGADGLQAVRTPLLLAGTADVDLPYDREARPVWDELGSPRRLASLHHAGHWAFTDLCLVSDGLLDCAGPPAWMAPERVRALTTTLVTAHVRRFLAGTLEDTPWTEGQAAPDLTWEQD